MPDTIPAIPKPPAPCPFQAWAQAQKWLHPSLWLGWALQELHQKSRPRNPATAIRNRNRNQKEPIALLPKASSSKQNVKTTPDPWAEKNSQVSFEKGAHFFQSLERMPCSGSKNHALTPARPSPLSPHHPLRQLWTYPHCSWPQARKANSFPPGLLEPNALAINVKASTFCQRFRNWILATIPMLGSEVAHKLLALWKDFSSAWGSLFKFTDLPLKQMLKAIPRASRQEPSSRSCPLLWFPVGFNYLQFHVIPKMLILLAKLQFNAQLWSYAM